MTKLLERVFRTGVQALWVDDRGQHWMSIRNRSYTATYPVPADRVPLWRKALGGR